MGEEGRMPNERRKEIKHDVRRQCNKQQGTCVVRRKNRRTFAIATNNQTVEYGAWATLQRVEKEEVSESLAKDC